MISKLMSIQFGITLLFFVFQTNIKAQSPSGFAINENPDLRLEKIIGWIGNVGYFEGDVAGKRSLVCVDSSFNIVKSSPIEKEVEELPYKETILLGHNIYSFYSTSNFDMKNGDDRDLSLISVSIDRKSLTPIGPTKKIYGEDGEAKKMPNGQIGSNDLFNKLAVSDNHQYILFYSELISDSSSSRFIRTISFDSSLNEINSSIIQIGSRMFFDISSARIDNKGDGFVAGYIFTGKSETVPDYEDLFQQEYYLHFLPKKGKLLSTKVSFEDKVASSIFGFTTSKNDLIICGGYSENDHEHTKGLFVKRYDKMNSLKSEHLLEFDSAFINKYPTEKIKYNELANYQILKVFCNEENDNLIVIADCSNSGSAGAFRSNLFISAISPEGKLIKNINIPRYINPGTSGTPIVGPAKVNFFEFQSKIHIIFNNDIRNMSAQLDNDQVFAFLADGNSCVSDYIINADLSLTPITLWKYSEKERYLFDSAFQINLENALIKCFWKKQSIRVTPSFMPIDFFKTYNLSEIH